MDRRSIFRRAGRHAREPRLSSGKQPPPKRKVHRLAIHVDQKDPAVMNLALNNTRNVYEHYKELGEEVAVEIVAYHQGLHMLREDTSPVKDKIAELRAKVKNLTFSACNNTKRAMEKAEGQGNDADPGGHHRTGRRGAAVGMQEQGWACSSGRRRYRPWLVGLFDLHHHVARARVCAPQRRAPLPVRATEMSRRCDGSTRLPPAP